MWRLWYPQAVKCLCEAVHIGVFRLVTLEVLLLRAYI